MHEVYPEARQIDADRIASIGRWLQDLPAEQARAVLDERLTRIEQLRRMLADPDWDQREGPDGRVRTLLAYLDQSSDLIPDDVPVFGLLDDVILLELAWPALATEAEDYADFCSYRDTEQPAGDGAHRREAWINDRLQALALLQHHNRVNESRYAESGQPRDVFRVR
ncbi:YkvA family protein [Thermomonas sp.]